MTKAEKDIGAFWEGVLGYPAGSYIGSVGCVPIFRSEEGVLIEAPIGVSRQVVIPSGPADYFKAVS